MHIHNKVAISYMTTMSYRLSIRLSICVCYTASYTVLKWVNLSWSNKHCIIAVELSFILTLDMKHIY